MFTIVLQVLRDLATADLALRSFFGAVDRSVRLIVQRRAQRQREEEAERHERGLRLMRSCLR